MKMTTGMWIVAGMLFLAAFVWNVGPIGEDESSSKELIILQTLDTEKQTTDGH
jgi:hypothetical protein